MKTKISVLLFLTSVVSAQIFETIGFKVGLVQSQQAWNYADNTKFDPDGKVGINLGIFAESFNSQSFALVTELNYVQKGAHKEIPVSSIFNPDGTGETIDAKMELSYLNISILAKGKFNFEAIIPYALFGPKLDYQLDASGILWAPSFDDELDKNRFGIKAGVGAEFSIASYKFLAEAIYDYEFNSLFKNELLEIKTDSFIFNLGMIF